MMKYRKNTQRTCKVSQRKQSNLTKYNSANLCESLRKLCDTLRYNILTATKLHNTKYNSANLCESLRKLCDTLRYNIYSEPLQNFYETFVKPSRYFALQLQIVIILLITSCASENYSDLIETNTTLNLKFNTYQTGTNTSARIGLDWALSQIGASKTVASFNGITQQENIFTIDYEQLGFNENAKNQLEKLHQKIKNSQEYKTTNAIDLGRYVALIIGASEHYYKINNVPENINVILDNYTLQPSKGYVDNSLISNKHRIVEFSEQNELNQLFLATEVAPNTGEILEYETIEIMKNGHLKFGIFNANGIRKNNATPTISSAGKPGKCMWCHESKISQLFSVQNDFSGYLSYLELQDTLVNFNENLIEKQLALFNGVDFSQHQNHTKMELLYISFMEPSIEVLSKEWNLSISQTQNKLQNLTTHLHEEFAFLGELYHRNEVEEFAPFTSLAISTSVREASVIEVNYLE